MITMILLNSCIMEHNKDLNYKKRVCSVYYVVVVASMVIRTYRQWSTMHLCIMITIVTAHILSWLVVCQHFERLSTKLILRSVMR